VVDTLGPQNAPIMAGRGEGDSELNRSTYWLAGGAAVALLGLAALLWWQRAHLLVPTRVSAPASAAQGVTPKVVAAPGSAASAPAIAHPLEALGLDVPAGPPDIEAALGDLVGRKAMLDMFQTQDFARRVVATVDNLGRSHAPAQLWPVNPTAGRLVIDRRGGTDVIGSDNGLRYTPFVLLVESVDLHKAVALYARLYPQLQQAYADIGFPSRYFNDRLVEVIDLLLATPEPEGPPKVRLPQINGPLQPQRPWALYEFDDPALQSLRSGQKILLRMGPVNERRVKARLAELRRLVTSDKPPR
jgi:hypothetical protein